MENHKYAENASTSFYLTDQMCKASDKIPRGLKAWRHKQNRLCGEQYGAAGYKTEMKGVIFHYGLFKIIWDWFVLLLVLYTAIEVPFIVAFILEDQSAEKLSSKFNSYNKLQLLY
ncbi:Hypothetical predicted protein [Paramuricea clavata]|uniref:Uncharacterized protein n=1 Tax=Paramuricea clavata TaxID=317549 RepID=A0A7D9HRA0_PARCT|nr:Hypothetical predicted protein [Paramuricea clavata]